MMKRALSLMLCLIMLLSVAAPTVQASGVDDIYVENGSSMEGGAGSAVQPTDSLPTGPAWNKEEIPSVQTSPTVLPEDTGKVVCDCGTDAEDLTSHSDGCALKKHCISLCAKNPMDIYHDWYILSVAERAFIKEYLAQHDPQTLELLQVILNGDQIADENDDTVNNEAANLPERLEGEATVQVGDITVDAVGVPEGSSLTVQDASKQATNAVENKVNELGDNPEQIFLYDISVQNGESDDWQPDGTSVQMELTIPDVKLHKHATVYVIHVDDEGNTSTIEAKVNDEGAIVFETEGFSTFGGFTVDFEYGAAFYSIQGLSEIKISELFDHLQMPLYASDVVGVAFSDYSLISVTQLEGDWLLTSLKAFRTRENLTVTMKDGSIYEIKVTDAQPDIIVGGGGFDGVNEDYHDYNDNNEVVWNADGDGELETQWQHIYKEYGYSGYEAWNDGWSRTSTVYVGGAGTFWIHITPYSNVYSESTCYVKINQIRALNNVDLIVRLSDDFDSTSLTSCQFIGTDANMFYIDTGASLTITGRPATGNKAACYLTLNGQNLVNTKDNQAIRLDPGATGLLAEYVRFENCPRSAIKIKNYYGANSDLRLQTFRLNRCVFANTVRRESNTNTGSGGAIYVESYVNDANGNPHYVWMDELRLSNCTFDGCYAAESGGAIGIYGIVKDINIATCQFNGTYAKKNFGGAIAMAGHGSTMTVTNTTFNNCSAPAAGGAIYLVSRVILAANGTYSRLNEVTFSGCTFKNDNDTSISNGQTINSALGGAMSLDTSINVLNITGCTFSKLKATEGGGICFGYTNMVETNQYGEYVFMSNSNFTTTENATKLAPDANNGGSTYYRSTIGDTTITNCDFVQVSAETQGGALRFRTNGAVKSVTMDDVNFDSCEAVQAGSAIMLGDTIIPSFTYSNSIIQNCKTSLNDSSEVGGTFRTIGKTTCAAFLTNIQFINNASHCSGGGVYWNAAGVRRIWENSPVTTAISLDQCTFDGNTAGWYGGGIYCESVMSVTKCELKNNISVMMGGAIALQLYNNTVRPFADNEVTNLQLDSATKIHHNQSNVGGGISIRANATLALDNTIPHGHTIQFVLGGAEVHHNYAVTDGGGVWFSVDTYDTSTENGYGNQQEVERFNKSINLNSGSVYSNTAGRHGGGIFMNGGTVTDRENTSDTGLNRNGYVTINLSGAAIYDNEAGRLTTGVVASAENVLPPVFSVTKGADGNIAFTKAGANGGNGGGIYMSGNTGVCYISGGVIGATKNADGTPGTPSKNIATRSTDISLGGSGGGIAIFGEGRIEMDGGYVVNNTADTAGGGIAVHDSSSMYLTGGNIKNNQAHMGGGISLNAAKAFNPNSTKEEERYGIYLNGGNVLENIATPDISRGSVAYGGGICISAQSTAKINNGLIKDNIVSTDGTTASGYAVNQEGGGVAVCEGSEVTFAGGTIEGNQAYDGGGMVVRGASTVYMTGSLSVQQGVVDEASATGVFKKNYAYHNGGAVYLGPYKGNNVNRFTMSNGWIYDNEADTGSGGGVYVSTYNGIYLLGGYIDGNSAQQNGGAIYGYYSVVEVSNGVIQNNLAELGSGGAIYAQSTEVKISNGVIKNNIATRGTGGGLHIYKGSLVFNGNENAFATLLNNRAPANCGGGLYGSYVETVDIDYLRAEENSSVYGGGIYLQYCNNCTIDGGVFTKNYSNQGAGLFVRSGCTTIKGGEFTYNMAGAPPKNPDGTYLYVEDTANKHGGGIVFDDLTTDVADSWAKIEGGVISHNSAPYGGGIWIKNIGQVKTGCSPNVTMTGGDITYNTATDGGGVYVDGNGHRADDDVTSFTIKGGNISNNTADGKGGGVYAAGLADVQIFEDSASGTHGTISHNTAYSGGGIAVVQGATLEVTNGYITYNTAYIPANPNATPAVSGYKHFGTVFGAGGGIFLARGKSDAQPSTFTLDGNSMAIYGNEAGFAADDVFSSGEYTKLDVPLVQDMNLAEYGFNPEGWFEDYNPNDTNYANKNATGLNMLAVNGAPAAVTVQRYRDGNATQRRYSHINSNHQDGNNYVRGNMDIAGAAEAAYNYVNKLSAYVCMTLGIPSAVDDVVVVDFGAAVDIDIVENDLFMSDADFRVSGELGRVIPDGISVKDGIYYSVAKDANGNAVDHLGTFYEKQLSSSFMHYGWLSMGSTGIVTYRRSGYEQTLDFMEKEHFTYTVKHGDGWFYANVTVIPATTIYFEDNMSQITYHTSSDVQDLAEWKVVGKPSDTPQDDDRPGAALLEGLDADNIYGYDSTYASTTTYSNNSAHWVTVTRDRNDPSKTTNARASFTFKGTGFDIVSLCSAKTGLVMVSVYKGEYTGFDNAVHPQDTLIASYMVDTHYGYGFNEATGKWELNEDSSTTLYQVPVIKVDLTKVMTRADDPDTEKDEATYANYGYGTYTVEIYIANSFLEREPGYWSSDFYLDGIRVYNPAGIGNNIDDTILNAYKDDKEGWPAYAELRNMFVSQKNLNVSTTEGIIFIDGQENPTLADYSSWGPNNEIYLNPGQHVAFTMNMAGYGQDVVGIHMGMRGLTNKSSVLVQAGTSATNKTTLLDTDLSTTDMYYNIGQDSSGAFVAPGKVITITNDGEYPIAISTVKVTHGTKPSENSRIGGLFENSLMTSWIALDILSTDPLGDPVVTPKRPALSFNGMVCYNVFFAVEDMGELTADDLGLAVFNSYEPDGTVWSADEVIHGATQIDGEYMVTTSGVNAKYLGDTKYFRAFAKMADGSYIYSKMVSYSAVDYAKNVLEKSDDVKLRRLAVAMLNYGAEAQKFFGYKTDDLMNKTLTQEDQALLDGYDADALNGAGKVDASKVGAFASTGGFGKKSPAISFNGAFEINYFFTPLDTVYGDMKLYVWNQDTYNSVTELTAENADKVVSMVRQEDGSYTAASDEIAAKYLDQTVYVAAVYDCNGVIHSSGVLPYSIAAYCQKPPAGVQDLASAAAIYGLTAKEYFVV